MALNYTPSKLPSQQSPLGGQLNTAGNQLGNFLSSAYKGTRNFVTNGITAAASVPVPTGPTSKPAVTFSQAGIPSLQPSASTLNYTPNTPSNTPAATAPVATNVKSSSLASPAAQQYVGNLANNQVNIGTAQNPNIQTNGQSVTASPYQPVNGLSQQQTSQGYSTIPGSYNAVTGAQTSPLPTTPASLNTSTPQQNPNVQQIDPTTGQPIVQNSTANQANNAFSQYLQSLKGDQNALATFNNQEKVTQAKIGAQPILSSFATGQQAVQQAAAQAEQQNLAQNVTNDQTGISNILGEQGIGVQQQQNANTLALGLKPVATSYGQTVFNPATGTFSGGSGSLQDPQTMASTLAQQVASGKTSYADAVQALGYAGAAGTGFLQQALQQIPGINLNQLEGQSAATQQNAATIGGISTSANATGYTNALQTYNSLNTAANAAKDQATSVSQILSQSGLNNLNSTDANTAINNLSGRLGSTSVTALTTAIAELQNRYSTLLAQNGTTPSGAQEQALALLSPNATAKQINQAIDTLQNSAGILVGNQYQQLQGYANQLNGGGSNNSTGAVDYTF